ncbi:ABC transporter permease [Marinimicrobium sp. C6131]|uniref:ABC transporter permease n=1 Tax=Marinimicrobium sp. C6131 TaxID=3022676 RepID=UPI00223DF686|nr:ABC transporter permease [Marinimicrobium sp. C6131]UZJ43691.1 ABC transporter permease [Marinimicrobium sp. C6131]
MDGLQEILYTLRQNKLRTALTAFGVFWGIFMLILLLGAGRGMQNGVYDSFGTDVRDFIVIWSGETSVAHQGMSVGRRIQLTTADLTEIKRQIPGVGFIASENRINNASIRAGNKTGSFSLHGIPDDFFRIKGVEPFDFGRELNRLDQAQLRKSCLLGRTVVERLFGPGTDPVGQEVTVNNVVLTVVGVFYDRNNRGQDSERIYIADTTYRTVFGGGDNIQTLWLRPAPGHDGVQVEQQVIELLKQRHQVADEDRRAIQSFNMAGPAKMVSGLFLAINAFIWFVGLGTLTAGIVGVSNIMIITVKERTREIGIRKALGATPFNIVKTLLLESILVTSIAGYAGLVLGVGLIELMAFGLRSVGANLPFFQNPEVNFQAAITAIVLLVIVGALAGLVPALKAARIMPIEAMRAE